MRPYCTHKTSPLFCWKFPIGCLPVFSRLESINSLMTISDHCSVSYSFHYQRVIISKIVQVIDDNYEHFIRKKFILSLLYRSLHFDHSMYTISWRRILTSANIRLNFFFSLAHCWWQILAIGGQYSSIISGHLCALMQISFGSI